MVKYLEAAECICLAISVCNLIAVGFTMKKQKSINKIMYFVNNLGIVVLSNLIVWTGMIIGFTLGALHNYFGL